jgi:hypothetical protein
MFFLRKLLVGTFAILAGFGIFCAAPTPKAAATTCWYSQTLHVTTNDVCRTGSKHWTYSPSNGTHYGSMAYSYEESITACYVGDSSYGTIVY